MKIFGTEAGFIALGLLVFDPNLLDHGAVVATDMGLSCLMFAAVYAFYPYLKAPSAAGLAGVGLAAGLALAAKHSAILVFPMFLGLALYELLRRQRPAEQPDLQSLPRKARSLQLAGALLVVSAISLAILLGFYAFRYRARSSGLALNPPLASSCKACHGRERCGC